MLIVQSILMRLWVVPAMKRPPENGFSDGQGGGDDREPCLIAVREQGSRKLRVQQPQVPDDMPRGVSPGSGVLTPTPASLVP